MPPTAKKLGQILFEKGWITTEQLNRALQSQRVGGGRLGTCLLEIEALPEEILLRAIGEQLGVPSASADELRGIPDETISLIPPKVALRCRALPFRSGSSSVDVAMLDVRNLSLQDELGFVIGKRVRVHVALEARIAEALEKYYGDEAPSRIGGLLDRLNRAKFMWDREGRGPGQNRGPTGTPEREELSNPFSSPTGAFQLSSGMTPPPIALHFRPAGRAADAVPPPRPPAPPPPPAPVAPARAEAPPSESPNTRPIVTVPEPVAAPSPPPAPPPAAPRPGPPATAALPPPPGPTSTSPAPAALPTAPSLPEPAIPAAAQPSPPMSLPALPLPPAPTAARAAPPAVAPGAPTAPAPTAEAGRWSSAPAPPPAPAPAPPQPALERPRTSPYQVPPPPDLAGAPPRALSPASDSRFPTPSRGLPIPRPAAGGATHLASPAPLAAPPRSPQPDAAVPAEPPLAPVGVAPASAPTGRSDPRLAPIQLAPAERDALRAAAGPALLSLDELERRLADPADRDEVARLVVDFLVQSLPRAVIFMVRKDTVAGWIGRGRGLDDAELQRFEIDFTRPSVFLNLRQGSPFYRGPLAPLPIHRELARCWGGKLPRECMLVPIHLRDRLVSVLYADVDGREGGALDLDHFQRLAQRMAGGLEACIVKLKSAKG